MAVSSKKRLHYGERVGKKLVFKAMPKRERQRGTTRRLQRKEEKKNNDNNKTGAVYKPVIINDELGFFVFFVNGPRAFWFIVAVSQFKDV